MERGLQRLCDLTQLYGPSGFEYRIKNYMKSQLSSVADEIIYDNMGGIFGVKYAEKEDAPKVLVVGHMDEVGFMITQITSNGMLKFEPVGGWRDDILLSQRFVVMTREGKEITGVVSSVPTHFLRGQQSATVKIPDMLLDIGADDAQQVEQWGIQPGDMMVPEANLTFTPDGKKILAKAIDNRYGCALALEALSIFEDTDLPCHLYSGATVQEEVGLRGAAAATNLIQPDIAIVVDASPANDMLGGENAMGQSGKGALIRIYDRTMILKPEFRDLLLETCHQHDIAYQYYVSPGGTDAGVIHQQHLGIPTAVLGVCARYIHTHTALLHLDDFYAARKLLSELIPQLTHDKIEELKYGK